MWKFQKRDAVNVHRLMPFLSTVPSGGCMSGQGSAFHGFCIFLTAPFCTKYRCGQTVWASQPALHDYAKSEFLSAAVNHYCVKRRCLGIPESRDSASLPWHTFPLFARMTKRHRPYYSSPVPKFLHTVGRTDFCIYQTVEKRYAIYDFTCKSESHKWFLMC